MRPAGKVSAVGHVAPKDYGRVLRATTWSLAYTDGTEPKRQTEANSMFFSTMREKRMRTAAREVLAQPSIAHMREELGNSNINIGFDRPSEVESRRRTETKSVYIERPMPKLQSAEENKQRLVKLRESHIDLAFGVPKTGKSWQTDQAAQLCDNADKKFACEGRPSPFDGSRNYKSKIHLGNNVVPDRWETETKRQYAPATNSGDRPMKADVIPICREALEAHNWDHAMGRQKTTTKWRPAQSAEYARKAEEKYNCIKPTVDPSLERKLRASSIYLGKDQVDYLSQHGRVLTQSSSAPGPLEAVRQ